MGPCILYTGRLCFIEEPFLFFQAKAFIRGLRNSKFERSQHPKKEKKMMGKSAKDKCAVCNSRNAWKISPKAGKAAYCRKCYATVIKKKLSPFTWCGECGHAKLRCCNESEDGFFPFDEIRGNCVGFGEGMGCLSCDLIQRRGAFEHRIIMRGLYREVQREEGEHVSIRYKEVCEDYNLGNATRCRPCTIFRSCLFRGIDEGEGIFGASDIAGNLDQIILMYPDHAYMRMRGECFCTLNSLYIAEEVDPKKQVFSVTRVRRNFTKAYNRQRRIHVKKIFQALVEVCERIAPALDRHVVLYMRSFLDFDPQAIMKMHNRKGQRGNSMRLCPRYPWPDRVWDEERRHGSQRFMKKNNTS